LFLSQVVLLIAFAVWIRRPRFVSTIKYEYSHYFFICIFFGLEIAKSFLNGETDHNIKSQQINFETLFASKFIYFSLGTMMLSISMVARIVPLLLVGTLVPIFLLRDLGLSIEFIAMNVISFLLMASFLRKNNIFIQKLFQKNNDVSYDRMLLNQMIEAIILINKDFKLIYHNEAAILN